MNFQVDSQSTSKMPSILKYNLTIQFQLKTTVITPTNSFYTKDLQEGQAILALQVVRVFLIPPRWRKKEYMGTFCKRKLTVAS